MKEVDLIAQLPPDSMVRVEMKVFFPCLTDGRLGLVVEVVFRVVEFEVNGAPYVVREVAGGGGGGVRAEGGGAAAAASDCVAEVVTVPS